MDPHRGSQRGLLGIQTDLSSVVVQSFSSCCCNLDPHICKMIWSSNKCFLSAMYCAEAVSSEGSQ